MRVAANIYRCFAIAVLGFLVFLLVKYGVGIGSLVLAVTACASWVLARGLARGRAGAGRVAIAVSSFLAVGFALIPLYLYVQAGWAAMSHLWVMAAALLALAGAHAVALVFLFRDRPVSP